MPLYVFDILILAILAFFAWRGAKKGLILGVCSLAGIFIAFFGARLISSAFYLPVSNILEPGIYQTVLGAEPQSAADPGTSAPPTYGSEGDLEEPAPTYSLEELLDSIHEAGLVCRPSRFYRRGCLRQRHPDLPCKNPGGSPGQLHRSAHLQGRVVCPVLPGYPFSVVSRGPHPGSDLPPAHPLRRQFCRRAGPGPAQGRPPGDRAGLAGSAGGLDSRPARHTPALPVYLAQSGTTAQPALGLIPAPRKPV